MDNSKDDKYFANKAIENIEIIQKYINGKTYDEFGRPPDVQFLHTRHSLPINCVF